MTIDKTDVAFIEHDMAMIFRDICTKGVSRETKANILEKIQEIKKLLEKEIERVGS